jgi:hypothetical protein
MLVHERQTPGECHGCARVRAGSVPFHYAGEAAAEEGVRLIARGIADDMIYSAHNSGDSPIAWVTGNNFMPPLRSYSMAERVWQADYPPDYPGHPEWGNGYWDFLAEEVERLLDAANVCLSAPEEDNCLYVIDLSRFEAVDEDEVTGDDLQDEWKLKAAADHA